MENLNFYCFFIKYNWRAGLWFQILNCEWLCQMATFFLLGKYLMFLNFIISITQYRKS